MFRLTGQLNGLMLAAVVLAVAVAAGAQTPDTDWYTNNQDALSFGVSTADELAGLAVLVNDSALTFKGKTINILEDIDLSTHYRQSYNGGKGWKPIGTPDRPFSGVLQGSNATAKEIKGLYINDPSLDYAGLFGYTVCGEQDHIRNLAITGVAITAQNYVGAVVGKTVRDTTIKTNPTTWITSVSSSGKISAAGWVGGLIGEMQRIHMGECFSTCDVETHWGINGHGQGGLVGGSVQGRVWYSYATGKLTGHSGEKGGIAGVATEGEVSHCVAINPLIEATDGNTHQIVGAFGATGHNPVTYTELSSNYAYAAMEKQIIVDGADISPEWQKRTHDGQSGTVKQQEEILATVNEDGKLLHIGGSGWVMQPGMLPGHIAPVPLPEHLGGPPPVTSTLSQDRTIPSPAATTAAIAPIGTVTTEFTAGPNPAGGRSKSVKFFARGKSVTGGSLSIYDATGNLVKKLRITGKPAEDGAIAAWDGTDKKARPVAAGTYLAKGTITAKSGGKPEKVSALISVR